MNNYCTNCGKKLINNELVCNDCDTPIVELPYGYDYKSPMEIEKKKKIKKVLLIIGIILLCILGFYFARFMLHRIKVNKLKNEYVEPYLEQKYSDKNHSVRYESEGKCIVSGDCVFDPVRGCDGGMCEEYKYLDENECKSYYYFVEKEEDKFYVTLFYRNQTYSVVEGKNIYGNDNNEDDYEN